MTGQLNVADIDNAYNHLNIGLNTSVINVGRLLNNDSKVINIGGDNYWLFGFKEQY